MTFASLLVEVDELLKHKEFYVQNMANSNEIQSVDSFTICLEKIWEGRFYDGKRFKCRRISARSGTGIPSRIDSEQISPAEKESVLAEEKEFSTDVDIPEMTAPDDEKSAFSNNGKHATKPTLLIKMRQIFRQLTRDRQNRRSQKLKRVKGSFSGNRKKNRESEI